jgi:hypothetical protein
MTGLRGSAHHTLATPARLAVRPTALALAALLVTAILAVAIVLAASDGGDQAAGPSSARPPEAITYGGFNPLTGRPEAAPLPPSAAQRHQPPGLNGPGAPPNQPPVGRTQSGPPNGGPDRLSGRLRLRVNSIARP